MRCLSVVLAAVVALLLVSAAAPTNAIETDPFWRVICSAGSEFPVELTAFEQAAVARTKPCPPPPTTFQELPSVGGDRDTTVALDVGYDAANTQLCFDDRRLIGAPVIHVGVGRRLTVQLTNTLHNTKHEMNCAIQSFSGETACTPQRVFPEAPGADGAYYPIEANQAHNADGTTNLHVHGLFVSPQPCSDEVLKTAVYPANWVQAVAPLQPCQTSPDTITYTYDLPAHQPSGLYWYHTHRHGTAEAQTQMGLVGAIVVEDESDAQRRAIGVTDEVLVVGDTPLNCNITACGDAVANPVGGAKVGTVSTPLAPEQTAQAVTAPAVATNPPTTPPVLDPRIDEANQVGGCAIGATGSAGGYESWSLTLNGAPVQDNSGGLWPPNFKVLAKTMLPGQRQLFRLVNASADSFIAPQMATLHDNVLTIQPLEVYARDGVGLTDANGNRRLVTYDVATNPIIVPPAGRIEFVVHAPAVGDTLYLQSAQVYPGCAGNMYPPRRLLRISSSGTPVAPGAADDSDLLGGSKRLQEYLATLGTVPSVVRTFVLTEYSRAFTYSQTKWVHGTPKPADYNPSQVDFYFTEVASTDGSVQPKNIAMIPFNPHAPGPTTVVHLHGKKTVTEDWLIENATMEIHDFHIHQVHFRDVSVDDGTPPNEQPLLDSITVPAAQLVGDSIATSTPGAPGWVKLRMTFTTEDIGEFVFHCHILEHEDNGMMAKVRVVAD